MKQKKIKPVQNNEGPGEKRMETAYKLSSALVRDRIGRESETDLKILEELSKEDVIVVLGDYDHIHLVLKHFDLPFSAIFREDVAKMTFRPDQTVFVNCGSSFPVEGARKLASFVASGGQLITTDWALRHVIEHAFPGNIKYNERPTKDEVVRIEIIDRDDPVLTGFLDEEADPVWWLEGSSYPIQVVNQDVEVLIRSKELGENYREDPVVVKFKHGDGLVYHMISHFYLQRSETRDIKQKGLSSAYSQYKGASLKTQKMFEDAEMADEGLDYGTVQSANTSAEFVSRAIISHKKKYSDDEEE